MNLASSTEAPARRTYSRTCLECGAPFSAGAAHAEFCDTPCRKAWNNRRLVRGAELYDLIMALRFDRHTAKRLKVWRLICRMASMFRDEDHDQRASRQSWGDPASIVDRRPYLLATTVLRRRRP